MPLHTVGERLTDSTKYRGKTLRLITEVGRDAGHLVADFQNMTPGQVNREILTLTKSLTALGRIMSRI